MGESVIKGKKIRKESRLKNEGMRGFSSNIFRGFFGLWWGGLTYIHERRKGEERDSFDCEGWKGVEEQEKGRLQPGICQVRSLFFFLIFLVFPFTFHSRFFSCFRDVILADWSGYWGPLIYVVESKFPSSLLCYDCILDFLDSFYK